MSEKFDYDLVVIGCGPAGQKAALAAAKMKKRVAVIEPRFLGGICTHVGTVPSKTFREAAMHLTNYRLRYMEPNICKRPTIEELEKRVGWVIQEETKVIEGELRSNRVDILSGYGKFHDTHEIGVYDEKGKELQVVKTKATVISTGTRPYLRPDIKYDGKYIFYTDNILCLEKIPRSMTIVGGGIIGCEYVSIFSILGVKINLIEKREEILSLVDRDMRANLNSQLDTRKVNLHLSDEVESMHVSNGEVVTRLGSGKTIRSDVGLFCTFRILSSDELNLEAVGVELNNRGVIKVDETFQTTNEHIYAAGDVIGHPGLASTSFEQGRIAGAFAVGGKPQPMSSNVPIGIYTIPEISYVGPTEKELTEQKIPYVVGKSFFKNTSRGTIMGALDGVLKIMFHEDTRKVLAVHVIGEGATELIHVGQAVMELGGTVDYFVDKVFNYPTLAETYKYAALSGLNRSQNI